MGKKSKVFTIKTISLVAVGTVAIVGAFWCFSGNKQISDEIEPSTDPFINETTSSYSKATEKIDLKPQEVTQPVTEPPATETPNSPTMSVIIATEITQKQTEPVPQPITEPATEYTPATEPVTEIDEPQLEELISGSGYSISDINAQNIEQLVLVDVYGVQADIYMYSYNNDMWKSEKLDCSGFVGENGAGNKQTEDDGITPTGLYSIGDAFYTQEQPVTWLNTFRITENTYWVNDPDSAMYNQKVEGEQNKDWNSAEHMIENDEYKYGCVINYNTNPIEKGKGSAIFMCCGNSETTGSVAFSESDMLAYLNVLNSAKNPHILIF